MLKTHIPVFKDFKKVINNPDSSDCNFLLEGDNLHSLKLLERTHKSRIDVIYIDPPYNTLNDDFVYGDTMLDENDGFKHSKWLSFMKERLEIARKLLSDDGVIFISIDDREQTQLKLLCDGIFGEENFYGQFVQQKGSTQNDSKMIQRNHEYILCYVKNNTGLFLRYKNETKQRVFEDEFKINDNLYIESTKNGATGNNNKLINRPNLGYTVYYKEIKINSINMETEITQIKDVNNKYDKFNYYISNDGRTLKHAVAVMDYDITKVSENAKDLDVYTIQEELLNLGYVAIRPPKRKGNKLGCWTWSLNTFKKYWNNNEVLIKDYKNIIRKAYIDPKDIKVDNDVNYYVKTTKLPLQSIISITNSKGTVTLKNDDGVLPGCDFNNPKSVELLKFLVGSYHRNNAIILDFFAGSGTTAQSVLELNKEDGGDRHFILCTNNEVSAAKTLEYIKSKGYMADVKISGKNKTIQSKIDKFFKENPDIYQKLMIDNKTEYDSYGICEAITLPRIETVITGIRSDGSKYSDGIKANLLYFKSDMIDKEDYDIDELLYDASFCLAELEHMTFIDDISICIAECDEDIDDIIKNVSDKLETVFIADDVLLDNKQKKFFEKHNVAIKRIPNYYYKEI